jgi:hypothetical protein
MCGTMRFLSGGASRRGLRQSLVRQDLANGSSRQCRADTWRSEDTDGAPLNARRYRTTVVAIDYGRNILDGNAGDAPLGPFQGIWEAWEGVKSEIAGKPLYHFRRAIEIQFDELEAHLAEGNRDAAAREVIDMVSIALNTMRWLSFEPAEIAEIARMRAIRRMKGQAQAILDKYQRQYGI